MCYSFIILSRGTELLIMIHNSQNSHGLYDMIIKCCWFSTSLYEVQNRNSKRCINYPSIGTGKMENISLSECQMIGGSFTIPYILLTIWKTFLTYEQQEMQWLSQCGCWWNKRHFFVMYTASLGSVFELFSYTYTRSKNGRQMFANQFASVS